MEFGELNPALVLATVIGVALAPFVGVMVTSFTKIVIVLALLRNALGLQQTPPNIILNGMALVLSLYIMAPVFAEMATAVEEDDEVQLDDNVEVEDLLAMTTVAEAPLREFLYRHSSETERRFFLDSARSTLPEDSDIELADDSFLVVIPAFVVSELAAAFLIGFLIYLPFLIIDLITANLLMALGMIMMPPTLVSLPFKLLLFVVLEGWSQLIHGLVMTYA